MITVVDQAGRFLRINGHAHEWTTDEAQATTFASTRALVQCFTFGRLAHLGLRFFRWR